jgi:hypothetical protein
VTDTVVIVQGNGTIEVVTTTAQVEVTTPETQVVEVVATGPAGPPGPLGPFLGHIWIDGSPATSEVVFQCIPGETLTVGANLANWIVRADIAATATTVITIVVEGVTRGTLTWAPGGTIPTLATTGGTSFTVAPTQRLSIVCPSPPDATLGDISIRVYATR